MVGPQPSDAWMTYPRPNMQARLRLFCFPYAGSGASIFRLWPQGLPSEVEVCAVQLPGRENRLREPAFTRLVPLIQTLSQALLPHLYKPFAFFGHSMGALISFELARWLRSVNALQPVCLFVSGRAAPQLPDVYGPIHTLRDAVFLEEIRSLNGTPEKVLAHPELMRLMLPILRADFALCETYTYAPNAPLDCFISAFGGLDDPRVSRNHLQTWKDQTNTGFTLHMLPGDHFFLHTAASLLLQTLSRELRQAMQLLRTREQDTPSLNEE